MFFASKTCGVLGKEDFYEAFDVPRSGRSRTFTLEVHDDVEVLSEAFWLHEEEAV